MKEYFQIEEVALKTGLTKRTLRYYEDMELIVPSRTEAGYRLYSQEDIENLLKIVEVKESLGFCLSEIKDILELEKAVKDIFKGQYHGMEKVTSAIERVKKQIQFVEKKEQTLLSLKTKYNAKLIKLLEIEQNFKGEIEDEKSRI